MRPDSSLLEVRPYRPGDLLALYEICLRTGDIGQDATHLYRDPMLLGHFYAAPYATLCPETCFVLDDPATGEVVGYVLGVSDTTTFDARCETEWFPVLRRLYGVPPDDDASPDARLCRMIHQGMWVPDRPWLVQYPAHLHIDLLPQAQGRGFGRRLVEQLTGELGRRGVSGVYLGVSVRNLSAVAFYEHIGFRVLERSETAIKYGLRLH